MKERHEPQCDPPPWSFVPELAMKKTVFDPHLEPPPQEALDATILLHRVAMQQGWGDDWQVNGIGPKDRPRYPIHPKTLTELKDAVDIAKREAEAWEQSAAQYARNVDYYRGLLDTIALMLGDDAFTADDGGRSAAPLRAKVPEVVRDRLLRLRELEEYQARQNRVVGNPNGTPCDPEAGWGTVNPEIND